jgi:hypothetical protein
MQMGREIGQSTLHFPQFANQLSAMEKNGIATLVDAGADTVAIAVASATGAF